jgi:hypothetical protein
MYAHIERGETEKERARERGNRTNIEMNRERKKENDDYIVVIVAAATGAPIADVQSMALSLPDRLPVLLQGHPIATPSF